MSKPLTPEEFERAMLEIFGGEFVAGPDSTNARLGLYDEEESHPAADDLMCQLLSSLGYEAGVELFKESRKWYG